MIYAGPRLSAYTKFAVFEIDTVDNNQNNLISGVTSNPNPPYDGSDALFQHFSGGYRLLQDGRQPYGSITAPINTTTLLIATADSVDSELYINGTQDTLANDAIGKVDGTGVSLEGDWEIGSFFGAGYLDGKLAELVVVPSVLSLDDRQKLEGYAAHKWGFTSALPPTHPYKTASP